MLALVGRRARERSGSGYVLSPDLPEAFVVPEDPDDSDGLEEEGVLELGLVSLADDALSPDSLLIAFFRASDG